MALGPKQMGEAILRNLAHKTGKPLAQWISIVQASTFTGRKPVMDFLKSEYGLGHFQAQKIYEGFSNSDIYKQPEDLITSLFHSAELLHTYKEIEATLLALGIDVRVQPCKTYIPFYRRHQFALVTLFKGRKIMIGLNLPNGVPDGLVQGNKTGAGERIN